MNELLNEREMLELEDVLKRFTDAINRKYTTYKGFHNKYCNHLYNIKYLFNGIKDECRGGVYVIKNRLNGKVKIGKTHNFEKRISQLKGMFKHLGMEEDIQVIRKIYCLKEDTDKVEKMLHERFSKNRDIGEWFVDIDDEILDERIRTSQYDFGDFGIYKNCLFNKNKSVPFDVSWYNIVDELVGYNEELSSVVKYALKKNNGINYGMFDNLPCLYEKDSEFLSMYNLMLSEKCPVNMNEISAIIYGDTKVCLNVIFKHVIKKVLSHESITIDDVPKDVYNVLLKYLKYESDVYCAIINKRDYESIWEEVIFSGFKYVGFEDNFDDEYLTNIIKELGFERIKISERLSDFIHTNFIETGVVSEWTIKLLKIDPNEVYDDLENIREMAYDCDLFDVVIEIDEIIDNM